MLNFQIIQIYGLNSLKLKIVCSYIAGWRDSILSLPKKWLSVSGASDEFGFPEVRKVHTNKFDWAKERKREKYETIIINRHWSEQTKLNENDCYVWRDLPKMYVYKISHKRTIECFFLHRFDTVRSTIFIDYALSLWNLPGQCQKAHNLQHMERLN